MSALGRFLKREIKLSCLKCGRSWSVPRNLDTTQKTYVMQETRVPWLPAGQCSNCGGLYCQECASTRKDFVGSSLSEFACPKCGALLKETPYTGYVLFHAYDYSGKKNAPKRIGPSGRKMCRNGHLNSPSATICWKCSEKLD